MIAVRGAIGFVLLDRLVDLRPGEEAVATVCFQADDPVFGDHFPGRPIVPGVLLTEAMAQAAGWLVAATVRFTRWPLLVMIDHAKFGRFVKPGETLTVRARLVAQGTDIFEAQCAVRVGEARVSSARLVLSHLRVRPGAAGRTAAPGVGAIDVLATGWRPVRGRSPVARRSANAEESGLALRRCWR